MKLRKVILPIMIVSMIFILLPLNSYAIMPVQEYNPTSVLISKAMEWGCIALGIAYLLFAIIYLRKTKEKKTIIQQMKTLVVWLIITAVIIIVLWYFVPIVKEIGMTYTGRRACI